MASAMYSDAVIVGLVATFVKLRLVGVQVRPDLYNVTCVATDVVAKLGTFVATALVAENSVIMADAATVEAFVNNVEVADKSKGVVVEVENVVAV